MISLNVLSTLRTKEELIQYFKEMGKNITEEEIEELKKKYEQIEKNNGVLSLQQLSNVAGGVLERHPSYKPRENLYEIPDSPKNTNGYQGTFSGVDISPGSIPSYPLGIERITIEDKPIQQSEADQQHDMAVNKAAGINDNNTAPTHEMLYGAMAFTSILAISAMGAIISLLEKGE